MAVAWNGLEVTATQGSGEVWTSPDGTSWTQEWSPTTYQLRTMVAVGTDLWVFGNKANIHRRSEVGCDFGDAPDPTYPTMLASDGAHHVLGSTLHLGAAAAELVGGHLPAEHGAAARARVRRDFSIEAVAARHLEEYRRILRSKTASMEAVTS